MTLSNYWWLIIWLFLVGGICSLFSIKKYENVLEKQVIRWKKFPAFVLILPYIIWAGFRTNQIGDTYLYRKNFLNAPNVFSAIMDYIEGFQKDKAFYWLTCIFKCVFSESDSVYFLVIAAIQLILVAIVIRKYSCNYWLGIFIFVATTDYLSWTYNGIRQFLAVTIIFGATSLLLNKKFHLVILIILFASTLHGSALIMLPIVWILQGKPWNIKTVLCVIGSVLALIFVSEFTNLLDFMLEDTQYTNVVSNWKDINDDGTNPFRVLVYSIPALFSLIGYKQIKRVNDPVINLCTNASILATALGIISMGTSGIILGRLPIYVSMWSNSILLPWEIENLFTKKSSIIIELFAIGCYMLFFYYQMHFTWALL